METSNNIQPVKPVKKQKKSSGLAVLIIIVVLLLGFACFTFFDGGNSLVSSSFSTSPMGSNEVFKTFSFRSQNLNSTPMINSDYIAKIYITGIIQKENKTYNQKWLLDTIDTLKNDSRNKGIILFIDSPGGSVYEADELYLALSDYQSSHKPVWSYMASLAASGGYYIACGSTHICANRNTLTGSIGVIAGQSLDLTELMQKYGIKSKTFTAGKNKNMLNYNNPLTEEQEKIMQSIADECYEQFTTIVSFNRNIPIEQVKTIADGRIYTAKQALNLKLIDKICSFDEAVTEMRAKFDLSGVEVVDYKYVPKLSIYDMLYNIASGVKPLAQSPETKLIEMTESSVPYPAYIYEK